MKEVLFLCHRIPYPPNKGDKIRAYHLLCALAQDYTVHLGTFVDDADDWPHRKVLDELCAETCYRSLPSLRAKIKSLAGLLTGEPLSFAYYRDKNLQRWVDQIMAQRSIDAIVVFSSTMAPYAENYGKTRRVLDFVDVDSEKWRQYAPTATIPMRWVYAREGRKLLAAERRLAADFNASAFVSEAEAELFRAHAPDCAKRIVSVPNGVDSAFFDPIGDYPDPYQGRGGQTLVFTGAMDYRANIDAVVWFVYNVLPLIQKLQPDSQFCIVGARPTREVLALADQDGIKVAGTVPDIRPYLAHAALAVAPLRIARGLQNKVLEALSMGKRVVLTPEAATGLEPLEPEYAAIESEPQALAAQTVIFLKNASLYYRSGEADNPTSKASNTTATPREYVLKHYSWATQLENFLSLVDGTRHPPVESTFDTDVLAGGSA